MLKKTEWINEPQGRDEYEKKRGIQDMLTAYRSTPHPGTGIAPYQALMNRPIRTELDHENAQEKRDEQDVRID